MKIVFLSIREEVKVTTLMVKVTTSRSLSESRSEVKVTKVKFEGVKAIAY